MGRWQIGVIGNVRTHKKEHAFFRADRLMDKLFEYWGGPAAKHILPSSISVTRRLDKR